MREGSSYTRLLLYTTFLVVLVIVKSVVFSEFQTLLPGHCNISGYRPTLRDPTHHVLTATRMLAISKCNMQGKLN